MNEVFTHAAFGQFVILLNKALLGAPPPGLRVYLHICTAVGDRQSPKPSAPYSIFEKAELESRVVCCRFPSSIWVERAEAFCTGTVE